MPRDIPVGNGRLLICFDQNYCLRDLYYPHVGQENHIGGHSSRLGVWVDNQFSWVGPGWKRDLRYLPDTLVTQVSLYHKDFGLLLSCRDAVDFHENIYLRVISVENMTPRQREVRRLDDLIKERGAEHLIRRTHDYWLLWVRKETPPLEHLPEHVGQLYRRSLLVLSTQVDWQGGIVAANDSDIINFARDTYCYGAGPKIGLRKCLLKPATPFTAVVGWSEADIQR